jgi:MarR family transcriptional regulator, organic hydroperoxide resistance regulator
MTGPQRDKPARMKRLPVLLGPEDLELRSWVQFVRTFTRIERRLQQALEDHGLTLSQFDVLATLGFEQGITQQELAASLLVTKGNICGLIDRMEANGWVTRKPDPEDRRVNRLFLTECGGTLLRTAIPGQRAVLREILGALDPCEIQILHQLLARLEESAGH